MKTNIINPSKLLTIIVACAALSLSSCAAAVVGGVAAAGGTAAATGTDARGGGTVVDDQGLEHDVNNVLSAQVPEGSFTVASYDGKILLAGQVPNAAAKARAQSAAENTAGVRTVWNYLTIGKNETAGAITHDAYLTSSAKTRLIAQKGVNTNNIKVVTSNKIVYLLGKNAGNPTQIKGAITGIKGISGVHNVVNLIGQ